VTAAMATTTRNLIALAHPWPDSIKCGPNVGMRHNTAQQHHADSAQPLSRVRSRGAALSIQGGQTHHFGECCVEIFFCLSENSRMWWCVSAATARITGTPFACRPTMLVAAEPRHDVSATHTNTHTHNAAVTEYKVHSARLSYSFSCSPQATLVTAGATISKAAPQRKRRLLLRYDVCVVVMLVCALTLGSSCCVGHGR
jgi:hypothetical protein